MHVSSTFLIHFCDIAFSFCTYAKVPKMSSCVPSQWVCDIIISHWKLDWVIICFTKVIGTIKHEQIPITLIGRYQDSKCNVAAGVGGTGFVTMHYKGQVGGQNGQILVVYSYLMTYMIQVWMTWKVLLSLQQPDCQRQNLVKIELFGL